MEIKPKVILMKVTSRERPEQLLKTIKYYIEFANNTKDMVWLFSFDRDCVCGSINFTNQLAVLFGFYGIDGKNCVVITGVSENKIHAINRDVSFLNKTTFDVPQSYPKLWDILLNISDDQVPIVKGYDDKIRSLMPDDLDASLWFNDGAQNRLNTQEIVGRNYYNRFGYIYHPSYKSLWCDNEAHEVAVSLGKLIKNKEIIIKHFHPGHMKGISTDALYQKNESFWNEDEANYKNRKALNFPA